MRLESQGDLRGVLGSGALLTDFTNHSYNVGGHV